MFAFVVVMALFLFAVDSSLAWIVKLMTGRGACMSKKWYVVHAYSGFEKSVMRALTERIKRSGMQDQFGQILVPVEEVVEMKAGQKAISERKFFPGYVLVEMEMTDDTWHLVKSTPKVTGFVGGTANKPTPISQKEVDRSCSRCRKASRSRVRRCCSRWARRCASRKARSPTSTATWRT